METEAAEEEETVEAEAATEATTNEEVVAIIKAVAEVAATSMATTKGLITITLTTPMVEPINKNISPEITIMEAIITITIMEITAIATLKVATEVVEEAAITKQDQTPEEVFTEEEVAKTSRINNKSLIFESVNDKDRYQ